MRTSKAPENGWSSTTSAWRGADLVPSVSIRCATSATTGSVMVKAKVLPTPGVLVMPICPPISSTKRLQMARPSPVPPNRRVVDASAWEKPLKICCWCSGAIPMPESCTENCTVTCSALRACTLSASTTWPWVVNLMALPHRLISTCCKRIASPNTTSGREGSTSNSTSMFLAPTLAESTTASWRSMASNRRGSRSSSILPASTLEKSKISFSKPKSDLAAPSVLLA